MRAEGDLTILRRVSRDERGISSVVVSICLVALFGATMLTVDAGSLWTARRNEVTATDASALDAALFFNDGGDPCDSASVTLAEQRATEVLMQNNPNSLHNGTDTPGGFEVTPAAPCDGTVGYKPGKVRFDGRLPANQTLSKLFGFGGLRAFASSTAAWGWITALGEGLRPIAVCDQSTVTFPDPMTPPPTGTERPHFELWRLHENDPVNYPLASWYDLWWGTDPDHYPSRSDGYVNGMNSHNPNRNSNYRDPVTYPGFHTVHRISMPDPDCGTSPGDRIWVDLTGTLGGTIGASELRNQLESGYKGTVSLEPHDCNIANSVPADENCGARPGDVSGPASAGLAAITCDYRVAADDCPIRFPVILFDQITFNGSNAEYHHVAFLFIVLRGFGDLTATSLQLDIEFVHVQPGGIIGPSKPASDPIGMKGVQLCGSETVQHCPF